MRVIKHRLIASFRWTFKLRLINNIQRAFNLPQTYTTNFKFTNKSW